jgi:transposase
MERRRPTARLYRRGAPPSCVASIVVVVGLRLFRGGSLEKLDEWLRNAFSCGIYSMRRFAKTLRQDKSVVQNAVTDPWSNGQTDGQINRLKTLKRSMYGRASIELLRARMLPVQEYGLRRE